jgi:N-methylhydantoinase B/oxoprolinase/acetone carboxylase alpha subunit
MHNIDGTSFILNKIFIKEKKMQVQEIFKQIVDANKAAYDTAWNAVTDFQEKAEEAMKSAFDKAPLPQAAKDAATKNIDAYKVIVKQALDTSKAGYENLVKTVTASQEKAEQMVKEYLDKMPIPEEAKKAFLAPMDVYKKACAQTQKVVEKNLAKVEESVEA